jgi:hypothetical protein
MGSGPNQRVLEGIEWLGHEADHLPLSSDKFKNEGSYACTSTYAFMACPDNFYLHIHQIFILYKYKSIEKD